MSVDVDLDLHQDALIDHIADVFLEAKGSPLSDDETVDHAGRVARIYGHRHGWTPPTIEDYARRVQRRVRWRLYALRRPAEPSR
jgi:hypothetical protein